MNEEKLDTLSSIFAMKANEEESFDDISGDVAEDIDLNPTESKYKSLIKLKKIAEDKENPYREIDVPRKDIYEYFYERVKNGPKTILQKCEALKENVMELRLEESEKRLRSLLQFGEEMVTNIRVANERREFDRIMVDKTQKSGLLSNVIGESTESVAKLEEITSKWFELGEIEEPMDLYENFQDQKDNIASVMASKDKLINFCQEEVDRVSEVYTMELARQEQDIHYMVERIESQVDLMREAYAAEMNMLENTLEQERVRIAEDFARKYNKSYEDIIKSDEDKFNFVKDMYFFYMNEFEKHQLQAEEVTRAIYMRLEKESEALEREFQWIKDRALITSEQLDYNYQVLQRRNEENICLNNQQKRRNARLTLQNTSMRKRIDASKTESGIKENNLQAQIKKLHVVISVLESKAKMFRNFNKNRFDKIWEINYKEISNTILNVFEIDKILTEQELSLHWDFPNVDLTDINADPNKKEKAIAKKMKTSNQFPCKKKFNVKKHLTPAQRELNETETRLYRNIFRSLADRTDFLLENSIKNILKPYTDANRTFVHVNNVLVTLNINDMDMVKILMKFFEPYTYCPNCQKGVSKNKFENIYTKHPNKPPKSVVNPEKDANKKDQHQKDTNEKDKEMKKKDDIEKDDDTHPLKNVKICKNHYKVMNPSFVLTALNDFTAYQVTKQEKLKDVILGSTQLQLHSINLSDREIFGFWNKFHKFFPKEKQRFWNIMEHGLNHYVESLKKRQLLDKQCLALRKQNAELKHFIQNIVE